MPSRPGAGAGVPLPPLPSSRLFEPAETVGRVGEHFIFRGELIGDANLIMAAAMEKISPEELEKNRALTPCQQRDSPAAQQLLKQVIDRKLMYIEFLRSIPPDKLKEVKSNIDKKISEAFQERPGRNADEDSGRQRGRVPRAGPEGQPAVSTGSAHEAAQPHLDVPNPRAAVRKYDSSLRQQQQAYWNGSWGSSNSTSRSNSSRK